MFGRKNLVFVIVLVSVICLVNSLAVAQVLRTEQELGKRLYKAFKEL